MDWRGLLRNRWVWLAGAGAAAVGGVAFLARRRSAGASGGSGDSSGAGETVGYTAGGVGTFDSTATDVAAQLGQYSASLDRQFNEFRTDINEALAKLPTSTEAPVNPTTPTPTTPTSTPTTMLFPAGTNVYNVSGQYGFASFSDFEAANPNIRQQIWWKPDSGPGGNLPLLTTDTTLRIVP